MQGSVQDLSPLNPGSPRWVFSQTLPFSACLRLSSRGAGWRQCWKLSLHTQMLLSCLFSPIMGQLQQRRCTSFPRAPSSCRARMAAAPLPSAATLCHPSAQALPSAAAVLADAACLLSACVLGGCWPAPALPECLPCPPVAAFPCPSLGSGNSVPAGSRPLRTGALSLLSPSLSLQPPE